MFGFLSNTQKTLQRSLDLKLLRSLYSRKSFLRKMRKREKSYNSSQELEVGGDRGIKLSGGDFHSVALCFYL